MTSRELFAIASKIDTMRKLERQVRRLNTMDCNQELTERQKNTRIKLECYYSDLAAKFGLFAEHQRDPRGSSLRLHDSLKELQDGSTMGVTL